MSSYNDRKKKNSNRDLVYKYLVDKGLKPHLAAGVVGNLMVESYANIDSSALNPKSGALGIAQWLGARKTHLYKFAEEQGKPVTDLGVQLDYLYQEISTTYKGTKGGWNKRQQKGFFDSKNVSEATYNFAKNFERAGIHEENIALRRRHASNLYLEKNDANIYAKDANGQIINVNPKEVTQTQLANSEVIKSEFYRSEFKRLTAEDTKQRNRNAEIERARKVLNEKTKEEKFKKEFLGNPGGKKEEAKEEGTPAEVAETTDTSKTQQAYGDAVQQTPTANNTPETPNVYPDLRVPENEFYGAFGVDKFNDGGPVKSYSTREDAPIGDPVEETPEAIPENNAVPNFVTDYTPKQEEVTNYVEIDEASQTALDNQLKKKEAVKELYGLLGEFGDAAVAQLEEEERLDQVLKDAETLNIKSKRNREKEARSNNLNPEGKQELKLEDYKTPTQVKALQQLLKNSGFNLNPFGTFQDDGVDGKAGAVTKEALHSYNSMGPKGEYTPYKQGEDLLGRCKEEQCSEYVQNEIFRNYKPNMSRTDWNKSVGIHGNAWDLGKNIIKAGGQRIASGNVQPGDVVGIGGTSSSGDYYNMAKAKGVNYTHSGVVDKVNPDGSYYVLHNWHDVVDNEYEGMEYRSLVNPKTGKVSGKWNNVRIAEVFRPNYNAAKYKEKPNLRKDTKLVINNEKLDSLQALDGTLFKNLPPKEMQNLVNKYISSANDADVKSKLANKFNLDEEEYQSISKAALGILAQESKFGTSPAAELKPIAAFGAKALTSILDFKAPNLTEKLGKYAKRDEVSRGPGRIKYDTNFGNINLAEYGINDSNFTKAENTMVAIMHILSDHYTGMKNKHSNRERILYNAIQKYNKGSNDKYARSTDVDYANKVINYADLFEVEDSKGTKYNTYIEQISSHDNVIERRKKLLGYEPLSRKKD